MAATTPITLKRHFAQLPEKETAELVEAVATLIVEFLKQRGELPSTPQLTQSFPRRVEA